MSWPKFEPGTSRIQVRRVAACADFLDIVIVVVADVDVALYQLSRSPLIFHLYHTLGKTAYS
jgi:hypothetical protein